ncbi:PH domain-containing protein DDB_G0287875-like [Toxorhynchites rutilus septentrionalis]|uniref:PH domain-containing protein DDB_G0287875-like n=1 Tax=Toxorhynchites rutilus septentrionalis TaxID=329112 RepID=UPI002478DAAE|nr:PH domain-containing protein DDB_G0287875-like [Toxorhynchites rutilus septentrionalis]
MSAPTAETHHCKVCNRPDEIDDMVACDSCNSWWHFNCAGVHESICDRSWRCNNCTNVSVSAGSMRSTTSSARLRLQQLQEKKELEDRLQKEKSERDRAYLSQKHQIEREVAEEEAAGGSVKSFGSHRSRTSNVQSWVDQNRRVESAIGDNNQPAVTSTSTPVTTNPVFTGAISKIIPPVSLATNQPLQQCPQQHPPPMIRGVPSQQESQYPTYNHGSPMHMLPPSGPTEPQPTVNSPQTYAVYPSSAQIGRVTNHHQEAVQDASHANRSVQPQINIPVNSSVPVAPHVELQPHHNGLYHSTIHGLLWTSCSRRRIY